MSPLFFFFDLMKWWLVNKAVTMVTKLVSLRADTKFTADECCCSVILILQSTLFEFTYNNHTLVLKTSGSAR